MTCCAAKNENNNGNYEWLKEIIVYHKSLAIVSLDNTIGTVEL